MPGREGEPAPSAEEPATGHTAPAEQLAGQARRLGQQHRAAQITPFGDAQHVSWDEGSARLLTALGVTSPATQASAPDRYRAVEAYCDALQARETSDIEPGV